MALSCKFFLAMALGLFASLMVGCASRPEGADYDTELALRKDGLVYSIVEDKPYTGKANSFALGPSECTCIMGCPLHWQGEFQDGKKHGTSIFPASRKEDAFFMWGDKNVLKVQFSHGIELHNKE
jgi:hypothetical protein